MSSNKKTSGGGSIAQNRKARHEFFIEDTFEAGLVLQGWEVKALRAGRLSLIDAYVLLKDGEAFLLGTNITPLLSTSTHYVPEATRTRKMLLNKRELDRLIGAVQQKGYTCIPLSFYWHNGKVKCEIALAKGKQLHDKRDADKDRDWQREKGRLMRDRG
ncbi:SsrA-binding protein [Fluviicoccus keumensis]|uniref:SsrA-binding protein n=1 Tax=Fluviicoccus keumensis TaxID=1435465 RepID=A0A4Q7Z8C4_9GAMM|nr:SsrA-binding protein SmpB [Fluviicoccus keumensis]RZU46772.1 SsrA-binding protein [Fluviicoccus keumensis]